MFSGTLAEVTYTCRIKTYPCGGREIMACSKPVFRAAGWEERDPIKKADREEHSGDDMRAIRRARAAVRDIAMSNPMSYFVTLTLDPGKIDRYDAAAVVHRMNGWLSNRVQRLGLKYVLVPEHHKDGAIHFHGFINDALPLTDSGTVRLAGGGKKPRKPRSAAQREKWLLDGGSVVYNIPGWTFGFSTALPLWGEYPQAVSYVLKYIGKDMGGRIGGRWYYSGGDLARPEVEYVDRDFREVAAMPGAYQFTVEEAGAAFVVVREAI